VDQGVGNYLSLCDGITKIGGVKTISLIGCAAAAIWCGGCSSVMKLSPATPGALVGAWRGHVQFSSGSMKDIHDLEFLYVFNAGGTMTESSNYDAAPPVTPAYGVWKKIGDGRYEARYAYFATKPPATFDEIAKSGGWSPAGHGELIETITLGNDGETYSAVIRYDLFDVGGKPVETGSAGTVQAQRLFGR
jgi:hypothetical protein